jgi:hypothetical protein
MRKEIYSLSGKFEKSKPFGRIGICKADYKIPYPCNPFVEPRIILFI